MLDEDQHVVHHPVDVHRARHVGLSSGPRQVEQAVHDAGGPRHLPFDLLQQLKSGVLRGGALDQHLREARDAGQRGVDLVGDAGR